MQATFEHNSTASCYARTLKGSRIPLVAQEYLGAYGEQRVTDSAFHIDYFPIYKDVRAVMQDGGDESYEALQTNNPLAFD